jgi:hypothetical protein
VEDKTFPEQIGEKPQTGETAPDLHGGEWWWTRIVYSSASCSFRLWVRSITPLEFCWSWYWVRRQLASTELLYEWYETSISYNNETSVKIINLNRNIEHSMLRRYLLAMPGHTYADFIVSPGRASVLLLFRYCASSAAIIGTGKAVIGHQTLTFKDRKYCCTTRDSTTNSLHTLTTRTSWDIGSSLMSYFIAHFCNGRLALFLFSCSHCIVGDRHQNPSSAFHFHQDSIKKTIYKITSQMLPLSAYPLCALEFRLKFAEMTLV